MIPPFFGYSYSNKKIIFNENTYPNCEKTYVEVAKDIVNIFLETKSYYRTLSQLERKYPHKQKGQHLDIPRSYTALRKWIQSAWIRGHSFIGSEIQKNTHPALISEKKIEELDKTILEITVVPSVKKIRKHPFQDKILCELCGGKMKFYNNRGKYSSYRCHNFSRGECSNNHFLSLDEINRAIIQVIKNNSSEIATWVYGEEDDARRRLSQYLQHSQFSTRISLDNNSHFISEIIDKIQCYSMADIILIPEIYQVIAPTHQEEHRHLLV